MVLTLKSNYLSFTSLSLSPFDNEFQVKGEIMIFSEIKSNLWVGTAAVTICGMPFGIKGSPVRHVPTYSTHAGTHIQLKVVI